MIRHVLDTHVLVSEHPNDCIREIDRSGAVTAVRFARVFIVRKDPDGRLHRVTKRSIDLRHGKGAARRLVEHTDRRDFTLLGRWPSKGNVVVAADDLWPAPSGSTFTLEPLVGREPDDEPGRLWRATTTGAGDDRAIRDARWKLPVAVRLVQLEFGAPLSDRIDLARDFNTVIDLAQTGPVASRKAAIAALKDWIDLLSNIVRRSEDAKEPSQTGANR